MRKVLLEYSEGTSDKFWEGTVEDCQFRVKYGRIGNSGQEKSWNFDTADAATTQLEKTLKEKLAKGYRSVSDTSATVKSTTSSPLASAAVPQKLPSVKQPASSTQAVTVKPATTAPVPINTASSALTTDVELSDLEQAYNFSKRRLLNRPKPVKLDLEKLLEKMRLYGTVTFDSEKCLKEFEQGKLWSREEAHLRFLHQYSYLKTERECRSRDIHHTSRKDVPDIFTKNFDEELQGVTLGQISADTTRAKVNAFNILTEEETSFRGILNIRWNPSLAGHFAQALPLIFLFPFCEFLALWQELWSVEPCPNFMTRGDIGDILQAIRSIVVPYISANELAELRAYLEEEIQKAPFKVHHSADQMPLPYLIAGLFGMSDLVEPAISSIPDGTYADPNSYIKLALVRPDILLFGLEDNERIKNHYNRLKLVLWSQQQCLAWIAHFGAGNYKPILTYSQIGRQFMHTKYYWKDAARYLSPIFKIKSEAAARDIFDLSEEPAYRTLCNGWLRNHLHLALPALLDVVNENAPRAADAKSFIKDTIDLVDQSQIAENVYLACRALNADIKVMRQSLTRNDKCEWFAELIKANPVKVVTIPNWLNGVQLEPIIIEGYVLSDSETKTILYALKQSSEHKIHPFLLELRQATPRFGFDKFVWNLFERWLTEDALPKDNWCMLSIGVLGSDLAIAKLLPLMKEWRAGSNHARAGFGLKCIKAADTDASLMIINKISQSASLKSMRTTALALISEIARALNLSPAELEDRIVPNCGLDDNGGRTFDYGKRKFNFVLSADLKPFIKDEIGKVRDDLPAPNQDDDPDLSSAAQAAWKEMKKLIKTTAKAQARRLELSMVSGRRWSAKEFDQFFIQHPLMWHLCKPLIWGIYDSNDKLSSSFRITDERDLADVAEKSLLIEESKSIGIVHALELEPATVGAWGQIMTDYELVPPFLQLNRATIQPADAEVKANKFTLFDKLEFEAIFLPSILEKRDWERFQTVDGGLYLGHFKYFPGKDITVTISYNGIYSGDPKMSEAQQIEDIYFIKGNIGRQISWNVSLNEYKAMAYEDVDRIVMSEIYTDLSMLAAKGKNI